MRDISRTSIISFFADGEDTSHNKVIRALLNRCLLIDQPALQVRLLEATTHVPYFAACIAGSNSSNVEIKWCITFTCSIPSSRASRYVSKLCFAVLHTWFDAICEPNVPVFRSEARRASVVYGNPTQMLTCACLTARWRRACPCSE